MLSRLSRIVWFLILLGLAVWFAAFWPQRPLTAVLGIALIPGGLAMVLALEFVALSAVSRFTSQPPSQSQDPLQPQQSAFTAAQVVPPTVAHMLRAGWQELMAVLLVFGWWQPFRAMAEPDHLPRPPTGQRGVVLVHGYVCNRAVWTRWFALLCEHGHPWIAVDLEPIGGSIDAYSARIDAAVRQLTAATGMAPVLICHSMGGLAARAWLRNRRAQGDAGPAPVVERIITLGTPHHGTWLAKWNLFPASRNAVQMQQHSPWLEALARQEAQPSAMTTATTVTTATTTTSTSSARAAVQLPAGGGTAAAHAGVLEAVNPYARFVCFYSHCDNIVFPPSTATLSGADNRHLPGVAHLALVLDPRVVSGCLSILAQASHNH
jgi:pimeloyl-ACP methyl ester carboxylesterase